MKIREIMRPGPITIHETDSLGSAQRMMSKSRVRHLPVMSDGRLVGMLSERDVLLARARNDNEQDWWAIPVHDVMTAPVQVAGSEDSLTEVAGRMAASKLGAMPIVERGKLVGIATVTDVLDAEVREAMAPGPVAAATASDAMTPFPLTIRPEAPLAEAVALMIAHHVRHLPVMDGQSAIIGVLSERDVRTAIGDPVEYLDLFHRAAAKYRVRDVMTKGAIAVPFDQPLRETAKSFADTRVGALPVVDKFGALIGIISYVDALRLLAA